MRNFFFFSLDAMKEVGMPESDWTERGVSSGWKCAGEGRVERRVNRIRGTNFWDGEGGVGVGVLMTIGVGVDGDVDGDADETVISGGEGEGEEEGGEGCCCASKVLRS